MTAYQCTACGKVFSLNGDPIYCPDCGKLLVRQDSLIFDAAQIDRTARGIWRYAHTFQLPQGAQPVTLGEGNTPLIWANLHGVRVEG